MADAGSVVGANYQKGQAGEFLGRDIKFVKVALTGIHTGYTAINSNYVKCLKVLAKHATVTLAGTPAGNNAMFMVEGLPAGSVTNVAGTSEAIATALATDGDAATGGSTTWTVYDGLSGDAFA